MKVFKKVAVYMMVATLSVGTVGLIANSTSTSGKESDGDIITNPWYEYFTKAGGSEDLPVDEDRTKKPGQETKASDTVKPPKKTKVKKASKKKSSKKAKITLKKIKGVKGYYVQISKTKKFKKVLVKKYVKKATFTIKNKKLKNKKTLYVRAKAYKLDEKTKVCSRKWSKAKKIKIKK